MKNREFAAIEAVIKRFAEVGKGVVVDVATLRRRRAASGRTAKPRLRFDRVVVRLFELLQAALSEAVPAGTTVAFTVTAPIRLAAKTGAVLEDTIKALLARKAGVRDSTATIHGNRVRIRLLKDATGRAPRVMGFVHHADSDPVQLLDIAGEVLEVVGAQAAGPTAKGDGGRWLVMASSRPSASFEVYRYVYSQLRVPAGIKKTLVAFDDGRVETLKG